MSSNIELFNELVGAVFAKLYSEFPIPQEFNYTEPPIDGEAGQCEDEDYKLEVWRRTIAWLQFAGYIHIEAESELSAMEVILTPKAFEVMKAIPSSLETNKKSIGDFLVENVKSGGASAIKSAVSQALALGFSYVKQQI